MAFFREFFNRQQHLTASKPSFCRILLIPSSQTLSQTAPVRLRLGRIPPPPVTASPAVNASQREVTQTPVHQSALSAWLLVGTPLGVVLLLVVLTAVLLLRRGNTKLRYREVFLIAVHCTSHAANNTTCQHNTRENDFLGVPVF